MKPIKRRGIFYNIFKHSFLLIFCLIAVFPITWILITAFKKFEHVTVYPPTFFPPEFTISPFFDVFKFARFEVFLGNSLIVSFGASFSVLIIACLAAYGLSRFRFPGAKIILTIFLLSQMFPGASTIIPIVRLILNLGLYNTRIGLILTYTGFLLPFSTWLLYGYFCSIPKEIEEAGFIDGCSRIASLFRIIMPLSLPGIGAAFIFSFIGA